MPRGAYPVAGSRGYAARIARALACRVYPGYIALTGPAAHNPHLTELIRECHKCGLDSNIALSGAYVTGEKLREFSDAGVTRIFVSLNGSTKEVNEKTRDGYELAIRTLELLHNIGWEKTVINWVMHECNADDFPNIGASSPLK